ncbi:MAG: hypothetical protein LBR10_00160 [Prevotellaceae bacterium]|jgi:hypothetical protein|nr:hypothetical protein [Prevotellaceae bacterium]
MFNVPNYQVVEFLDWLEHNHLKIEFDKEEEIIQYARRYLIEQKEGSDFSIKRVLKYLQFVCIVENDDLPHHLDFEVWARHLHFFHHKYCDIDYFFHKYKYIPIKLHPLLEGFYDYLLGNESRFRCRELNRISLFDHPSSIRRLIDSECVFELEKLWHSYIRNISEQLMDDFKKFCEEEHKRIEKYPHHKNHNENEGQLNINKRGIDEESNRLANSLKYFINNNDIPLLECLSVIKDDYPVVISFFGWIIEKYPKITSLNEIPYQKIEDEIDLFCDKYSYGEVVKLKKQVNNIFKNQTEKNLLDKIKRWFRDKGKENPFNRYTNVNFHGIFLFPYFNSQKYKDFINKAWYDLNSFTGNHIDIYYSNDDLEKKNGFDVLNELKGLDNIKITDLPTFLLWDKTLSHALSIPLADLEEEQIFKVMQYIVQSIKEEKSLDNIAQCVPDYINNTFNKKIKIEFHMENYNIINSPNTNFANRSKVEGSFNKISEQMDENTANVLKQIAEIVESSANNKAKDLFEEFSKEINKPEPKKSLLETYWNGLISALPILASTASITASILKIID